MANTWLDTCTCIRISQGSILSDLTDGTRHAKREARVYHLAPPSAFLCIVDRGSRSRLLCLVEASVLVEKSLFLRCIESYHVSLPFSYLGARLFRNRKAHSRGPGPFLVPTSKDSLGGAS